MLLDADARMALYNLLCEVFPRPEDISPVARRVLGDVAGVSFVGDGRQVWDRVFKAIELRKNPRLLRRLCREAAACEGGASGSELEKRLLAPPHPQASFDWTKGEFPFPGLRPYEIRHAAVFFGRDESVKEVLLRLEDHGRVVITGEAGTGKSSLAVAGVLAQLRGPLLQDADREVFTPVRFKPGPAPWDELAAVLKAARPSGYGEGAAEWSARVGEQLAEGRRGRSSAALWILLHDLAGGPTGVAFLVDQMEELLGYGDKSEERDAFLGLVAYALAQPLTARVRLVATIRLDALPLLQSVAAWRAESVPLDELLYRVPPVDLHAMEDILRSSLARGGIECDEELVVGLALDVEQTALPLPLAAFVLDMLWRECEAGQRRLRYDAYVKVGRIGGAVDLLLSRFWTSLPDGDRRLGERVLRYLLDATPHGPVRPRRATRGELRDALGGDAEALDRLLERMLAHNLLSVDAADGAERVELAHDALLRHWRGFKKLADDARPALEAHTELRSAVAYTRVQGQEDTRWSGSKDRREDLLKLHEARQVDLTREEIRFLEESRRQFHRKVAKMRLGWAGYALLLVVLVAATIISVTARMKAKASEQYALRSQQVANTEAARAARAERAIADFVHGVVQAEGLGPGSYAKHEDWGASLSELAVSDQGPTGLVDTPRAREFRAGRLRFSIGAVLINGNVRSLQGRAELLLNDARTRFDVALRTPARSGEVTGCELQYYLARSDTRLGLSSVRRGALGGAIRLFEGAARQLEGVDTTHCPRPIAADIDSLRSRVRYDLGNILAEAGDPSRAEQALADARAVAVERGPMASARYPFLLELRLAAAHWHAGNALAGHERIAALLTAVPAQPANAPSHCAGATALPSTALLPGPAGLQHYAEFLLRETERPVQTATHLHATWDASPQGPPNAAGICRVQLQGPLTPGLCFPHCRVDVRCDGELRSYNRDYACVPCAAVPGRDAFVGRDPDPYRVDGDGTLEFDTAARCLVLSQPDGENPQRFSLGPVAAPPARAGAR